MFDAGRRATYGGGSRSENVTRVDKRGEVLLMWYDTSREQGLRDQIRCGVSIDQSRDEIVTEEVRPTLLRNRAQPPLLPP